MTSSFSLRLFFATLLVIAAPLMSWTVVAPTPRLLVNQQIVPSTTEEDILFYVNDYRNKKGLPSLEMNADYNEIQKQLNKDKNYVVLFHKVKIAVIRRHDRNSAAIS